jgi:flagellar hook-basal body complex protein FliE
VSILPVGPVGPEGVAGVAGVSGAAGLGGLAPVEGTSRAVEGTAGAGDAFAGVLADGLGRVQQLQGRADDLALQAATGELRDVHDYMIASTEASVATQLTVAVRDKALAAFNEIMRMPV